MRTQNINISVTGGDRRNAFGGGNLARDRSGSLNSGRYRQQDNGDTITTSNLKKVFTVGFFLQKGQQANELVGAYSNNKLRQRRVNQGMTFAKYAIGISINPVVGTMYAVGDMAYRGISYGIQVQKQNREANYYGRISGNNANSGSRYRGGFL